MGKPKSPEEIKKILAEVRKRIEQGDKIRAIAADAGIHPSNIYTWLKKYDQPLSPNRITRRSATKLASHQHAMFVDIPAADQPSGKCFVVVCDVDSLGSVLDQLRGR